MPSPASAIVTTMIPSPAVEGRGGHTLVREMGEGGIRQCIKKDKREIGLMN